MKKLEGNSAIKKFNVNDAQNGNARVATISGNTVEVLTFNADDSEYKIQGYIGKSTQLESWTLAGKYYSKEKKKEKYQNMNNLVIIE